MRAKISILILLILGVSCSTKIVGIYNSDIDDKPFRTYGIRSSSTAKMSSENQSLDSLLHKIISTGLEEKGLKKSSIPDIYASYLVNIHSSSTETQPNQNRYRGYNYMDPFYNNSTTRTYKEGVLIIDITNDNGKLVWQGSNTFKIKTRQSIQLALPELCRELINSYKVK